MKVIIAGTRTIDDLHVVNRAMAKFIMDNSTSRALCDIHEIVSGGCYGVDRLGEDWAKRHGVKIQLFPARWDLHGKAAGPIRNESMGFYADALVAIWDRKSRGTQHMISVMHALKKPVMVWDV